MAVSGSQLTRIGASISGVAKALSISAKDPASGFDLIALSRSISRFTFSRVFGRVN